MASGYVDMRSAATGLGLGGSSHALATNSVAVIATNTLRPDVRTTRLLHTGTRRFSLQCSDRAARKEQHHRSWRWGHGPLPARSPHVLRRAEPPHGTLHAARAQQ